MLWSHHGNSHSRRNMSMIDVAVISASSMQLKRCEAAAKAAKAAEMSLRYIVVQNITLANIL